MQPFSFMFIKGTNNARADYILYVYSAVRTFLDSGTVSVLLAVQFLFFWLSSQAHMI